MKRTRKRLTSCALPALAVDTTYYWRVDAYDGAQTYVLCAPWSFTTGGSFYPAGPSGQFHPKGK